MALTHPKERTLGTPRLAPAEVTGCVARLRGGKGGRAAPSVCVRLEVWVRDVVEGCRLLGGEDVNLSVRDVARRCRLSGSEGVTG